MELITRTGSGKAGETKGDNHMFRNYVQSLYAHQPFQPMFEADQGGGGSDPGADETPDDEKTNPEADDKTGKNGGEGDPNDSGSDNKEKKVTFSDEQQALINQLIKDTIKKERTKAEAERDRELARQKMDEDERRKADLEDAKKKVEQYQDRQITYEIKDVAREMGVAANRVDRFLKLVDREDIRMDDDGNVDRLAVQTVVKAVLGDFPEFKATSGGKGPGSDYDKGTGSGAKYSMAQIKDMSQAEIQKNWDDVRKSMDIHNKK